MTARTHSRSPLAHVAVLTLALCSLVAAQAQEAGDDAPAPGRAVTEVAGTVLDAAGNAVADAAVDVIAVPEGHDGSDDAAAGSGDDVAPTRADTTTAADGSFRVEVAPAATVFVRVTAAGFAASTTNFKAPLEPAEIRLERGSTVRVRLRDVSSGKPVAGVPALLDGRFEAWFESPRKVTSDDEGRLVLTDVGSEYAMLRIEVDGFSKVAKALEVAPAPDDAEEDPVVDADDVFLEPGATIAGVVVDAEGEPLAGVLVTATDADPVAGAFGRGTGESVRSGDDGRFELIGMPVGRSYLVTVAGEGIARTTAGPFALERGEDVDDLRLRAASGGGLAMRLTGPDGPPPGADVSVRLRHLDAADFASGMRASPVSDDRVDAEDSGRVRVRNVEPGEYEVVVDVDRFRPRTIEDVTVGEGKTTDLGEITLDPGKWIAGSVVNAAGEPVDDARIVAYWRDGSATGSRTTRSAEDGSFRILGLGDEPVRWIQADRDGDMSEQIRGVTPGRDDLTLELRPKGSIAGRVRLADGRVPPTFEARAVARNAGAWSRVGAFGGPWQAFTGEDDGKFTLDGVKSGDSTVEVRAPGTTIARVGPVEVRAEERTDVGDIVLEPGVVLRGRVIDGEVESPVPGATVTAGPAGTMGMVSRMAGGDAAVRTAPDGTFEIGGLEPGRMTVSAQHADYADAATDVTIEAGVTVHEVELRMSRGGTLTGTVRDADGLPVAGARLLIARGLGVGASPPQFVTTSADGTYRADRLPPGGCVVARVPDNAGVSLAGLDMRQATITAGGVTVVDFDERPAITLRGRLLRGDEPVGNAGMMFIPSGSGASLDISTVASDENGWFEVGLERPGSYAVQVMSNAQLGRRLGGAQIEVPDEPLVQQDIELSTGAIRGVVVDEAGAAIEGAQLVATPSTTGDSLLVQRGGSALSAADGGFEITGLETDTYAVTATAEGFATAPAVSVAVSDAGGGTIEIVMTRGRRVSGQVVDPSGAPVAAAMVWAAPAGAGAAMPSAPATTDGAGRFEVLVPETGPATITVGGTAWAPAVVPVPPDAGDAPFVVRLTDGGSLRVVVTDEDGVPRPGMQVIALPVDPALRTAMATSFRMSAATDDAGRAELTSLTPTSYTVEVFGGGAPAVVATVSEGATAEVTIALP